MKLILLLLLLIIVDILFAFKNMDKSCYGPSSSSSSNNPFNPLFNSINDKKLKLLGLSSSSSLSIPTYDNENYYCLSSSKTLLSNEKLYSTINNQGLYVDVFEFNWLIKICNECPQYNIYNITAKDVITFSNINSFDNSIVSPFTINSVELIADDTSGSNQFNYSSFSHDVDCYYNPTEPTDHYDSYQIICNLFKCPSFLSFYNSDECKCNPDKNCAQFILKMNLSVVASRPTDCPIYNANVGNCLYVNGTLCFKNSKNEYCKNCLADSNPSFSINNNNKFLLSSSPNDFTDVCSKSCSNSTVIFNEYDISSHNFQASLFCTLRDDQCNDFDTICKNRNCDNSVFNCTWQLNNLDNNNNNNNIAYQFSLLLEFDPVTIPSECVISPSYNRLLLCTVNSNSNYPLIVNGVVCFPMLDDECYNQVINSTVKLTNLDNTGNVVCHPHDININNNSIVITVPESSNDTSIIVKNLFDNFTNEIIDNYVDCSDPSIAIQDVYYMITIKAPKCSPLTISFVDTNEYVIDTNYGLIISDPSILSCQLITPNSFSCNTGINQLSSGQVITVKYKINLDCKRCNYFDSVSCSNNTYYNNITDIVFSTLSCNLNNVADNFNLKTRVLCPCPTCDCSFKFSFDTLSVPLIGDPIITLRPSYQHNLVSNLLSCIVYSSNNSYSNYSTPVWGWTVHGSQDRWISQPHPLDSIYTEGTVLLSVDTFEVYCCAYQNTINNPNVYNSPTSSQNNPIVTGQNFTFIVAEINSGSYSRGYVNQFVCSNSEYSKSFPSHFPLFKKAVG